MWAEPATACPAGDGGHMLGAVRMGLRRAPSLDTSDQPCTVAPAGAVAGAGRRRETAVSVGPSTVLAAAVEGWPWAAPRGPTRPPALSRSQALVTFRMERHRVTGVLWKSLLTGEGGDGSGR